MPRHPTGRPRGRPPGSGQLDHPTRINVWLDGETYAQLEAYAAGRSFARGTPALSACARQAIEHFLACPQKHQAQLQDVTDTVTDTDAPQSPPRRRKPQAAPAD